MSYEISILPAEHTSADERISLSGDLCIFHAADLMPQLLAYLKPGLSLEVDLARVHEVDTAGVQLLLLAKREATAIDCRLGFINHSEALLNVIDLLNLSGDFGDPLLITANQREECHES